MIDSVKELIERYTDTDHNRFILKCCLDIAKRNFFFEASTRIEEYHYGWWYYYVIYKTDEFPEIPIIKLYPSSPKCTYQTHFIGDEDTTEEENFEFTVEFIDDLIYPSWQSMKADYMNLESKIEKAYVRVLRLENV